VTNQFSSGWQAAMGKKGNGGWQPVALYNSINAIGRGILPGFYASCLAIPIPTAWTT